MPPEKYTRRELFKLLVPASFLASEHQQPHSEQTPRINDYNESQHSFLEPSQYDQSEFNQLTAISISVLLDASRELFDRVRELEAKHPEYGPLPSEGEI